jgi:hypothetical protein
MRPILSSLKRNDTIQKMFLSSLIKVTIPDKITDEFNKFHIENRKLIKDYPRDDVVKKLGDQVLEKLFEGSKEGNRQSSDILDAIYNFKKDDKTEGLFLENVPNEGRASSYFTQAFTSILDYKKTNKNEIYLDNSNDDISEIPPHTDGVSLKNNFEIVTITGYEAPNGSYRTFIIPVKDVLKELDDKTINILCEPIFLQQTRARNFIKNAVPIFYRQEDGSIIPKFTSGRNSYSYEINIPENSLIQKNEAIEAINNLDNLLMDYHKNRELEGVYIKTGYNEKGQKITSSLFFNDFGVFHGVDQKGVDEKHIYSPRVVLINEYSKNEIPSSTLTNPYFDKFKIGTEKSM